MKIRLVRFVGVAAAIFIGSSAWLSAGEAAKQDASIAAQLVSAIEKADYAAFVADGEAPFKELKREQFEAVAKALGPKLEQGYELTYLGDLKQKGYRVTLWRIRFKNGGDDALATLSVKDGKVGGFWIR